MSDRPVIGQKCHIAALAYKRYLPQEKVRLIKRGKKEYPQVSTWLSQKIPTTAAFYVGYTVVNDGVIDWEVESGEYGTILAEYPIYTPKNYYTLWRFVITERSHMIYAFPEDVSYIKSLGVQNG